jgi:tRNA A37 methylthiotransferase MiaB
MLRQQDVLAERYRELQGRSFDVLVDRVTPEGVAVARTYFQGPEGDPVTIIRDAGELAAGQFARVEIAGWEGYELVARAAQGARRA